MDGLDTHWDILSVPTKAEGLYRIWDNGQPTLLYVGEGKIGNRVGAHLKSKPNHPQGELIASAALSDVSYVIGPDWHRHQRLELRERPHRISRACPWSTTKRAVLKLPLPNPNIRPGVLFNHLGEVVVGDGLELAMDLGAELKPVHPGARQPVQPIPEPRIAAAIVKAVVYIQLAFIDVLAPVMRHQAIAHHHRAPRRRPPAKGHQDVGHPQRQHRRSGLKLNRFKIGHRPHLHRLPMDTTPTAVHTLVQRSDRFDVRELGWAGGTGYIKWIN